MSKVLYSRVPIELECPDRMVGPATTVLDGEYECGYFGQGLTIVDIGANVGSFTLWANMRWPHSTIHAYEPHPETFKMLVRNTRALSNVICCEGAVFPGSDSHQMLRSRYPGDGEAGLVTYADKTFIPSSQVTTLLVPVIHPRHLPGCDILKVDVEGAEGQLIQALDVSRISLILVEYQDDENRRMIKQKLDGDFLCEYEDSFPWTPLLSNPEYRRELHGNHFGHLFFVNKHSNALTKIAAGPQRDDSSSLKRLLSQLPGAVKKVGRERLRKFFPRVS